MNVQCLNLILATTSFYMKIAEISELTKLLKSH